MSEKPVSRETAVNAQINGRRRVGTLWQMLFMGSTLVGIICLTALLYNIFNQAFGLVAIQSKITPESLVLNYEKEKLLTSPQVVTSEDDEELAAGVSGGANRIGFFGYAYYLEHQAELKVLSVEGVLPTAVTMADKSYPLERPLYLYTSPAILADKPEVAAFLRYYLQNVNSQILADGYFPLSDEALQASLAALPTTTVNEGKIVVSGSSTLQPLSQKLADGFLASGYTGRINLSANGTTAGLTAFCAGKAVDVVGASRAMTQAERDACRAAGREVLEIPVGLDAIAVVVPATNTFLQDVSLEQLGAIFTTATHWADVNETWPAEPIARYIPGENSGTLDFFTEVLFPATLEELPKEALVAILQANVSTGLGRRLERDQRFFADQLVFEKPEVLAEVCASNQPAAACTLPERDTNNVYLLLLERVVEPDVVASWSLVESLFQRTRIEQEVVTKYPDAVLQFRSWVTPQFLIAPQSSSPELAGVRTAVFGSLWVVAITILFSFPVGVSAAIYLEEYANHNWINRVIQTNINNLAGVPSIIYGILGLAIFVRALEGFTSGSVFGLMGEGSTANGRTILSAGLTLGLLILPVIIINGQEAIRAVPNSLRQAGLALGATKWQTIWHHVLPNALPGILTGAILAISRAIGETAPLVVVGASTFITVDPSSPFSKFTTLPIQIYQWTSRPQPEFQHIAAAAIVVLLVMLLSLNAAAVILRNKYTRRLV